MSNKQILLTRLSDGRFHSGEELGHLLGVSRAAVWKALKRCAAPGVAIDSVPGRGYKLRSAVELLDGGSISEAISPSIRKAIGPLEVLFEVDSTNSYLFHKIGEAPPRSICIAEIQTAGRGRRGRSWVSPFGANIYLSLLWKFMDGPARLTGLSLAIAIALTRALKRVGVNDIQLKWPNDVLRSGKKLAGILLEVTGESNGPCHVVIGIGINIGMPKDVAIDQPWSDVRDGARDVSRNRLAGILIDEIVAALASFESGGLAPFREEWAAHDAFDGRRVTLALPNANVQGIARGVDANGFLLLETEAGVQRFASGEVTMRGA